MHTSIIKGTMGALRNVTKADLEPAKLTFTDSFNWDNNCDGHRTPYDLMFTEIVEIIQKSGKFEKDLEVYCTNGGEVKIVVRSKSARGDIKGIHVAFKYHAHKADESIKTIYDLDYLNVESVYLEIIRSFYEETPCIKNVRIRPDTPGLDEFATVNSTWSKSAIRIIEEDWDTLGLTDRQRVNDAVDALLSWFHFSVETLSPFSDKMRFRDEQDEDEQDEEVSVTETEQEPERPAKKDRSDGLKWYYGTKNNPDPEPEPEPECPCHCCCDEEDDDEDDDEDTAQENKCMADSLVEAIMIGMAINGASPDIKAIAQQALDKLREIISSRDNEAETDKQSGDTPKEKPNA